jgi:hypothetical protein
VENEVGLREIGCEVGTTLGYGIILLSSSDNLIPVSAGVTGQAGQGGSTEYAAPAVVSPLQKYGLVTRNTLQCRLSTETNWSVIHF